MSMRISTHQAFLSGLSNLLTGQANVSGLQEQIATGKRIETPADDPVAAPQVIALNRQIDLLDQYEKNADRATNRLELEETTLGNIVDVLQRVRQLAVQGGDGALDFGSRKSISIELQQRVEELLGLANSRGTDNEFIFSGYQSNTQPFVRASGGGFNYQGDEGQLFLAITETLTVETSDSGKKLFTDIPVPNNFTVQAAGANTGTATVPPAAVTNQAAYDAFYPDDAVITFTVVGSTTTYSVTRASNGATISGGVPSQPLTNVPYIPGQGIAFEGIEVNITGVPATGDQFTALHSNPQKSDMLTIVEELANGLGTLGDGPLANLQRGELISDALQNLDNVLVSINQTVAKIGSNLGAIETVGQANEEIKLFAQKTLSKVEDLDFTEAISQLTQSSFVLQAAQQSYLKVSNLSLFNFIRS